MTEILEGSSWGTMVIRTDIRGTMADGAWNDTVAVTTAASQYLGEPAEGYRRIQYECMICPSDKSVTGLAIDKKKG